jgi:hypothetical protein
MNSLLFQKVDDIAIAAGLPFKVRPLDSDTCKIPFTVEKVAGLELRKYGKITAIETGILSAFRMEYIKESTECRMKIAELLREMSILLQVDSMEELTDLMGDADKLASLAQTNEVKQEEVQNWADRWLEINQEYNGERIKIVMNLDLVTFVIAMRGDNPNWDYADTYGLLTSEDHEEVLAFLYQEEGIELSAVEEKKPAESVSSI